MVILKLICAVQSCHGQHFGILSNMPILLSLLNGVSTVQYINDIFHFSVNSIFFLKLSLLRIKSNYFFTFTSLFSQIMSSSVTDIVRSLFSQLLSPSVTYQHHHHTSLSPSIHYHLTLDGQTKTCTIIEGQVLNLCSDPLL